MYRRWLSCIVSFIIILTLTAGCQKAGNTVDTAEEITGPATYEGLMNSWKAEAADSAIACWYTDENDKAWMEAAAAAFKEEYGIEVKPVYYDGVQLFEDINQANIAGTGPDVYVMGNDQLEFGISGGMLQENTSFDEDFWKDNYPDTAKNALTYKGKQYGYPVYFDTYMLVYDANLLENAPASIDDILAFLNEYEDTGSTKAVFRWDVGDPYINTMFIAAYADLFGENGDDSSSFSVNGDKEVEAMEYFHSLSEYLWMDKNNMSHDIVRNRIKEGTLVLGLCKSDILPLLYEMNGDGANETSYQVSYVPSLTAELSSSCFSTTYGAFINPYGSNEAAANMFSLFLSYEYQKDQFAGNGKLPVVNQKEGFDDIQTVLYAQYQNSKPVPKVMVLGDYMTESGIAFDAIWKGADAKEQLDKLQAAMDERIK